MEVRDLYEKYSTSSWLNFGDSYLHYGKYAEDNAHLILTGHKIQDVYYQVSNARTSLIFLEKKNYTELAIEESELTTVFIKAKFLFDALANYNYCVDLSWQALYLYHGNKSFDVLQAECYRKTIEEFRFYKLKERLGKNSILYQEVEDFLNDPLISEIRTFYNRVKHAGSIHIEGLGINDDSLLRKEGNYELRVLSRKEVNIEKMKQKLMKFDILFYQYFNNTVIPLMPIDFNKAASNIEIGTTIQNFSNWAKTRE